MKVGALIAKLQQADPEFDVWVQSEDDIYGTTGKPYDGTDDPPSDVIWLIMPADCGGPVVRVERNIADPAGVKPSVVEVL